MITNLTYTYPLNAKDGCKKIGNSDFQRTEQHIMHLDNLGYQAGGRNSHECICRLVSAVKGQACIENDNFSKSEGKTEKLPFFVFGQK